MLKVTVLLLLAASGTLSAASFTGPISPYYLSGGNTIYVVQGDHVAYQIPTAYGGGIWESVVAVSDYDLGGVSLEEIRTRAGDLRSDTDLGAGSYLRVQTPGGAVVLPTGGYFTPWSGSGRVYDGTTDGQVNYFVDHGGGPREAEAGVYVADYYWQDPRPLFGLSSGFSGIAYDPYDNSLWLSWRPGGIAKYSLTGDYLAGFPTNIGPVSALGLDPKDHTLWMFAFEGPQGHLAQYSLSPGSFGQLLQMGPPAGLPECCYEGGEFAIPGPIPEPGTVILAMTGIAGLIAARRSGSPSPHPPHGSSAWPPDRSLR